MGPGPPDDARNRPQPLLVPPVTSAVAERGHHHHHQQQPFHLKQLSEQQPYEQGGPRRSVLVRVRLRPAAGVLPHHDHVQLPHRVPPRELHLAAVAAVRLPHLIRHQHSSGQWQRGCRRRRNPRPVRRHHHHRHPVQQPQRQEKTYQHLPGAGGLLADLEPRAGRFLRRLRGRHRVMGGETFPELDEFVLAEI